MGESLAVDLSQPPVITVLGPGVHREGDLDYCAAGRWRLHSYATPAVIVVDGRENPVGPGWFGLYPPTATLAARFGGRSLHTCVHFQLGDGHDRVPIPELQDLGARAPALDAMLQDVLRWFDRLPHRSEARLWEVLWQLADQRALEPPGGTHAALERAKSYVHAHLADDLTVEQLAAVSRCSPNRLLALFRRELGCTTVGFLRACRVRRAEHLLRWSDIPIKEIAAEVGIPDLHFFNKTVRAVLGASPRAIRDSAR